MTWSVTLGKNAAKQFKRLPPNLQGFVLKRLQEMRADPFSGDVIALKGKQWKGRYRKRVGRYRIIFLLHSAEHIVEISAILLRNKSTYR